MSSPGPLQSLHVGVKSREEGAISHTERPRCPNDVLAATYRHGLVGADVAPLEQTSNSTLVLPDLHHPVLHVALGFTFDLPDYGTLAEV